MLRRLFVLWFLTLSGLIATCCADVANSSSPPSRTSRTVNCQGRDGTDSVAIDSSICENSSKREDDQPSSDSVRRFRKLEAGFPNDVVQHGDDGVNSDDEGASSGSDEFVGRRKKYKHYGKILVYMIGAAKATMLYMMIHAVAALAGKALIVGKVALAIATAVALKKAFEHNEKTSYEIVKHPHHTYVQTHSSSVDYDHHGGYDGGYGNHRKRRRVLR